MELEYMIVVIYSFLNYCYIVDTLTKLQNDLNVAKDDIEKFTRNTLKNTDKSFFRKNEDIVLLRANIICTTLSSCIGMKMEEVFSR